MPIAEQQRLILHDIDARGTMPRPGRAASSPGELMTMKQAAIFVDRDNTLIEDPGYLADASQVRLLPGVAEAIRRLNHAGYRIVVVTNQSGLARGLITESQVDDIHAQLELLMEAEGAKLDGIYYCPYLDSPEAVVPKYRRPSQLRKPQPGMLLKAAEDLDLDLSYSWMIGDKPEDVLAGRAAGCKTVLLAHSDEPHDDLSADYIVENLPQAAEVVLNGAARPSDSRRSKGPSSSMTRADQALPPGQEDANDMLRDIRTLLQQQRRDTAQSDFSLTRLAATLFQIVAVAILLWGLAAFISEADDALTNSLTRFALAAVIQLMALTLFINDRSR